MRSNITASPHQGRSASSRPSRWPTSATWRWPIRQASPPPRWRSPPILAEAANLTTRSNLVAVITNGTAVLGLGAIGPARRQAGDGRQGGAVQEVRRHRRLRHRDRRARSRQAGRDRRGARADLRRHQSRGHQGAGMLRDRARSFASALKIPVFHDDQHGTAIIVGAAIRNALRLVGKRLAEVKLVASGAGAAAIACLDLLVDMGLHGREHHRHRHHTASSSAAARRRWIRARSATPRRPTRARWAK